MVVACRRYRRTECGAVLLVVPRGVAPRKHYGFAEFELARQTATADRSAVRLGLSHVLLETLLGWSIHMLPTGEVETTEPRDAPSGAPDETVRATIWVDTNVMLEIFTFGDFFFDLLKGDAAQKIATREGKVLDDALAATKRRRVRLKNSLWMAMALCREHAVTISYHHEVFRNALKIAPPDTKLALPTKALFNALMPNGLFDGWTMIHTNAGATLGNKARDRLMVDTCKKEGLRFVSRDAGALDYARAQGVVGVSPEDYAARIMSLADARKAFLGRLDRAALLATFEHVGFSRDPGWLTFYLRQAIERYEGVWEWCWAKPELR